MSYISTSRSAARTARRTASSAPVMAFAVLSSLATAAGAQEAAAPSPRDFTGIVGLGVVTLPEYTGSDEYRVLPMPILQLEYRGRVFLGGSQSAMAPGIGASVLRTPRLTWDVGLSGAEARPESRGDALAGMGKRSAAAFATSGVAVRLGIVQATAGVAVGLGKDEGSYGTIGLGGERALARRWIGGLSTGVTVADRRNMAHDFGVTGEQAAVRLALLEAGDPRLEGVDVRAYSPKAGVKDARGSASLAYLLTERSRVVLFAQGTHLAAQAARSPIVRTRSSVVTGVALGWGF